MLKINLKIIFTFLVALLPNIKADMDKNEIIENKRN